MAKLIKLEKYGGDALWLRAGAVDAWYGDEIGGTAVFVTCGARYNVTQSPEDLAARIAPDDDGRPEYDFSDNDRAGVADVLIEKWPRRNEKLSTAKAAHIIRDEYDFSAGMLSLMFREPYYRRGRILRAISVKALTLTDDPDILNKRRDVLESVCVQSWPRGSATWSIAAVRDVIGSSRTPGARLFEGNDDIWHALAEPLTLADGTKIKRHDRKRLALERP